MSGRIAVVGAMGVVGRKTPKTAAERNFSGSFGAGLTG
jgi:aspartate-semialdehyde dehydrogenase